MNTNYQTDYQYTSVIGSKTSCIMTYENLWQYQIFEFVDISLRKSHTKMEKKYALFFILTLSLTNAPKLFHDNLISL